MSCKIIGCGGYLPKRIVLNEEFEKSLDTSDEWIKSRTGIHQRHLAAEDELCSNLAFEASKAAIEDAGCNLQDIDLIIVSTTTPDNSFPSTATKLQGHLGLQTIPAFDIQAVCAGFIYGLHIADSLMKAAGYKKVLLVGSEKMSSLLNWNDRSTCVLFGDGAGAVILEKSDYPGIIDSQIYSDGSFYDILYTDGGVSTNGNSGKIVMKGKEVFRHAVEKMADSITSILEKNNLSSNDISHFVPHQANIRIIDALAQRLCLNDEKIVKTISTHANCSAASVPLALSSLKASGKLKKGDIILSVAFGAGITWGASLVQW